MNIARLLTSFLPAAGITLALLLVMHLLIDQDLGEPDEGDEFKIPEITMPDREITTEYDTRRPDKPEDPEEPPPDLPEPDFDTPDIDTDIAVSNPKVGVNVKIAGIGGFGGDGDYLPIVKVAPKYPSRAISRGITGYCTVEYTVTKTGETRDIKVVDCPESIFSKASIKAASKFKYKPKVIDGNAIEVAGVRNRFTYQLGEEK